MDTSLLRCSSWFKSTSDTTALSLPRISLRLCRSPINSCWTHNADWERAPRHHQCTAKKSSLPPPWKQPWLQIDGGSDSGTLSRSLGSAFFIKPHMCFCTAYDSTGGGGLGKFPVFIIFLVTFSWWLSFCFLWHWCYIFLYTVFYFRWCSWVLATSGQELLMFLWQSGTTGEEKKDLESMSGSHEI